MWELLKSDYDVVLDYPKYGKDMNDELYDTGMLLPCRCFHMAAAA